MGKPIDQEVIEKVYGVNRVLSKKFKARPEKIGPLPDGYFDEKKALGEVSGSGTLYRNERTIPELGRPYVPIGIANYLTGYSVSFIKKMYSDGTLRGFRFPKCILMVSLYDLLDYIDKLCNFEIETGEVSAGLKRRVKKAQMLRRERKSLLSDPEFVKKLESGEASQRRLVPRRRGAKKQLRRKDGNFA